jgi:hypothetical protein
MANIHGKRTVVKLNGTALTTYAENSTVDIEADEHDLTTYGKNSHVFAGGLLKSSFTVSGFYDSTASTGPRALILPLVGSNVTFIHQPEGTGSGLPQDSVTVLVKKYSQTHPVADYVKWSIDLTGSDDVNSTPQ